MSALPSPVQNQHGSSEAAADPSMEEILASIRRIIADDHGTPLTPRPSRPAAAPAFEPAYRAAAAPQPAVVLPPEPAPALRRAPEPAPVMIQPEPQRFDAPRDMDVLRAFASSREPAMEPAPSRIRPMLRPAEDPAASAISSPAPTPMPSSTPAPSYMEPSRAPEAYVAAQSYSPPAAHAPEPPRPAQAPASASNADEPLLSPLVHASVTSAFEALTVSMAAQNTSIVEDAVRDMLRPMLKQWLDDNLPTIVERLVRAEIERVARGGRS